MIYRVYTSKRAKRAFFVTTNIELAREVLRLTVDTKRSKRAFIQYAKA